ncbi:MAG TPA: family 78 glycoside hydrolase catalytic domain [Verrucomicrobiae bacterium]
MNFSKLFSPLHKLLTRLPVVLACVLVMSGFIALPAAASVPLKPVELHCEYLANPIGIDVVQPRLSWVLALGKPSWFANRGESRDRAQTAYHILVASSAEKLAANQGDLWDSGKVDSDATAQIVYAGAALKSRQPCFWKVEIWDEQHRKSVWSETATWDMGLLEPHDWQGSWIGINMPTPTNSVSVNPAPYLRRDFSLRTGIKRARLYASGVGYLELHLNGQKVGGNRERDPGYTDFDKRVLYVTHDVTSQLRPGTTNTLGAILGTGWYDVHDLAVWGFEHASWRGRPRLQLMLVVDYSDGSSQTITSDNMWHATSEGPIRFDGIYSGEIYDARRKMPGWDAPGFVDTNWPAADVLPAPLGKLTALRCPPVAIAKNIIPKSITQPKPGVYVVDMGENFSGHVQLTVQGPAGTTIHLRYSECVAADGMVDRSSITEFMRPPKLFQEDAYVCKGTGTETWEQRFSYSGFRYVEVTGFPGEPTLKNFRGRFAHTDMQPAGEFSCSNDGLNQVQAATVQSYLSNAQNIPTDCPTREKNGWTGDAHLAAEAGLMNFHAETFYTKWLDDLQDNQLANGRLRVIVPSDGWGLGNCQPAWDSAYPFIAWYLYKYDGDRRILAQHYDRLRRYVDYLTSKSGSGTITEDTLGDWCPWSTETPNQLTATAFYYEDARIVSQAAAILGNTEDAATYATLAEKVKTSFNERFFNPTNNSYANDSQTALATALYFGLVPEERQSVVLGKLAAQVEALKHIDAGILGAKWIPAALSAGGRSDAAYLLASYTNQPGWISMAKDSKTLWEQWREPHSRNHIMFGSISGWFYQSLAGINCDPKEPGFKHILIQPHPVGDLTWVKATYDSIHGRIVSNWSRQAGGFTLEITIPVNTTATVQVPTENVDSITESGQPVAKVSGIKYMGMSQGAAVYSIGSGTYKFSSRLGETKS